MSLLSIVPAILGFAGAQSQASAAGAASAGESALLQTLREIYNRYLAQGGQFDPIMENLAKLAIAQLISPEGQAMEQGKAYEGLQQNLVSAVQNLIAQGGPDVAARMPQIARALGESALQKGAGMARDFAIDAPGRTADALKIATQLSGRSLLPGVSGGLMDMANLYGRSAQGANPYAGLADLFKNLTAILPQQTSIPDFTVANPYAASPSFTGVEQGPKGEEYYTY